MLEEYKQLYKECADLIPNWKDLSVLELANNYCELKDKQNIYANSYISAIIYKYWYLINYYYNRQQYKFATPEDCYDWLITSVNYVLQHQPWKNSGSSLYKDPEGPAKAISVCISNECSNFYVSGQRQKRVINNKKVNFNQLIKYEEETEEECVNRLLGINHYSDQKTDLWFREFIKQKIVEEFNKKEYFNAYALDAIINSNIFKEQKSNNSIFIYLDKKKFRQHFNFIEDKFCKWFSKEYSLDIDKVKESIKYISSLTNDRFNRNLKRLYNLILQDKNFRIFLDLDKGE